MQIEQLQGQCCQLEKELARKQGDADVFRREAENKLAERMRVALREQQLEYESQVSSKEKRRLNPPPTPPTPFPLYWLRPKG